MEEPKAKILIDSASPKERRTFLKKLAGVVAGITALGGFTNLRAKRTFSGTEVSSYAAVDPFIGSISMVGFTYAPRTWANCDGQFVLITENPALYSLLGTIFGGNGTTNFQLPDFRGRMPLHVGTGIGLTTRLMGQFWGRERVQLTNLQLPTHNHDSTLVPPSYSASVELEARTGPGGATADPTGAYLRNSGSDIYTTNPTTTALGASPVTLTQTSAGTVAIDNAGDGEPFDIMPPWLCVRFIIALEGTFPPRN